MVWKLYPPYTTESFMQYMNIELIQKNLTCINHFMYKIFQILNYWTCPILIIVQILLVLQGLYLELLVKIDALQKCNAKTVLDVASDMTRKTETSPYLFDSSLLPGF